MRKFSVIVVASTALSTSALAGDYDWGGVYGGFAVGGSGINRDAKVDYNTSAGATGSWSSNRGFASDDAVEHHNDSVRSIDNGADTASESDHAGGNITSTFSGTPEQQLIDGAGVRTGYIGANSIINPTSPWLDSISPDDYNGLATAKLGVNFQAGGFVFGLEADGSLLTNITSADLDINEASSVAGSATLGSHNGTTTPGTGLCVGDTFVAATLTYDTEACGANGTYSSSYTQNGDFQYQSSVDGLFTARARAGFAAGRALFFVSGGLAGGVVSMSTSANVVENVESDWSATRQRDGTRTDLNTDQNASESLSQNDTETDGIRVTDTAVGNHDEVYTSEWDASMSKMAWGWTVGGGMSVAVTDNIIWTTEGYYYDLGSKSISAQDSRTGAEYRISQRFDGYLARTGLEWKF